MSKKAQIQHVKGHVNTVKLYITFAWVSQLLLLTSILVQRLVLGLYYQFITSWMYSWSAIQSSGINSMTAHIFWSHKNPIKTSGTHNTRINDLGHLNAWYMPYYVSVFNACANASAHKSLHSLPPCFCVVDLVDKGWADCSWKDYF